jgi:hypothetical protein
MRVPVQTGGVTELPPTVSIAQRPADVSPEEWAARIRHAQLTLVRVLLRARARMVADGHADEPDAAAG